jgi:hypothetical protein
MKKNSVLLLLCLSFGITIHAQNVIWQDNFDGNHSWSEFEYKKEGSSIVKDGMLTIKCEDGFRFISNCKTNFNGNKNFTISVDATSKSGLKEDVYFGIVINYLDKKNFTLFAIEKGFAYFLEFKQGEMVRQEYDVIKKTKDKTFLLELKKNGDNILFVINGEETLDMEQVEINSSKIGLFVSGKAEVSFDNLKILQ